MIIVNGHEIGFEGCSIHNGEYYYKCQKCGACDWVRKDDVPDDLPCFKKICKDAGSR